MWSIRSAGTRTRASARRRSSAACFATANSFSSTIKILIFVSAEPGSRCATISSGCVGVSSSPRTASFSGRMTDRSRRFLMSALRWRSPSPGDAVCTRPYRATHSFNTSRRASLRSDVEGILVVSSALISFTSCGVSAKLRPVAHLQPRSMIHGSLPLRGCRPREEVENSKSKENS